MPVPRLGRRSPPPPVWHGPLVQRPAEPDRRRPFFGASTPCEYLGSSMKPARGSRAARSSTSRSDDGESGSVCGCGERPCNQQGSVQRLLYQQGLRRLHGVRGGATRQAAQTGEIRDASRRWRSSLTPNQPTIGIPRDRGETVPPHHHGVSDESFTWRRRRSRYLRFAGPA